MKWYLYLLLIALTYSCNQKKSTTTTATLVPDTTFSKIKIPLEGYAEEHYANVYQYWSITNGKDTLPISYEVYENKNDSMLNIGINHQDPINFEVIIARLKFDLPKINKEINLSKLNSIYFKSIVYYPDLASALSNEYEQQFNKKRISHTQLNQFLLHSSLNTSLNEVFSLWNKQVKSYGIEKFHLSNLSSEKKYLNYSDTNLLPKFSINGMGLFIELQQK